MTFKNFFGKTIEAAKKSAEQLYGENFLVVEEKEATATEQAQITVFSDEKQPVTKTVQQNPSEQGVRFERSDAQQEQAPSEKLNSLRRFAEEMAKKNELKSAWEQPRQSTQARVHPINQQQAQPVSIEEGSTYNRSFVRSTPPHSPSFPTSAFGLPEEEYEEPRAEPKGFKEEFERRTRDRIDQQAPETSPTGFITHFKPQQSVEHTPAPTFEKQTSSLSRNEQRELKALHKRFDQLEALFDASIMSGHLDYASHPAFQQLVHTGISTSTVARWFNDIIREGIDPNTDSEAFLAALAKTIREALGSAATEEPKKFMVFAGASGAGKTDIIMKLSRHPEFMFHKNVAVVSVLPQGNDNDDYFTILEPFCAKHGLPYYTVQKPVDVSGLLEEWEQFDHVLIDTPTISIDQVDTFREFWKIRQLLTPLSPIEFHYVVNASSNKLFFNKPANRHNALAPDYIAITHLDEVEEWGPIIPFLNELNCSTRYVSMGAMKTGHLTLFNPQWFAQHILTEA
ncbi:MAG: hypothetical protein AAFW89_05880 [Bacteroidota bacterium]